MRKRAAASGRKTRARTEPGRRTAALIALAEGMTQVAASEASGVPLRTLRRWLAEDEAFLDEVSRLQNEIVRQSKRILRGRVADAARRIVDLMDNATKEDNVRLSAAQDVLDRIHGKAPARIVGGDDELPPLLVQFVHPAAPKEKPVG